jgi:hypothetical protein
MESLMLDQSDATAASGNRITILADGERWFVVNTLPYQEKRAQIQLENQRYRTFLPKREKTIRHARKLRTVVAPFFPRYMFIILDPECDQWRPINSTLGVAGMVMQGDRPQPVPAGIVETLIASLRRHPLADDDICRCRDGFGRAVATATAAQCGRSGAADPRAVRRLSRHPRSPRRFRTGASPPRHAGPTRPDLGGRTSRGAGGLTWRAPPGAISLVREVLWAQAAAAGTSGHGA